MKRIISSMVSSIDAQHYAQYIPHIADMIIKIMDAETQEEAVEYAVQKLGDKNIHTRFEAVSAAYNLLGRAVDNYAKSAKIEYALPRVRDKVLAVVAKWARHEVYRYTGFQETYLIDDSADTADFDSLCDYLDSEFFADYEADRHETSCDCKLDDVPFKVDLSFNQLTVSFDKEY